MAESFSAMLKKELNGGDVYRSRADARGALSEYTEVFYNRRRMDSVLDYMTPDEFESCTSKPRVA